MLRVENLSFGYEKDRILKDLNFNIPKGVLAALLGMNGSGKSTLFKCCMNFLKPSVGKIYINNEFSLNKPPYWMAKHVSYVPQISSPIFAFSVIESVIMGRAVYMDGLKFKKTDYDIAMQALEMVGITHLKDKLMTNLSGGQKQLVLLCRAIAQKAEFMLLDEPTGALDLGNQILFWQIVKKIAKNGTTVFVCTHEPNHALWFCDEFVALKDGCLLDSGKIKDKFNKDLICEIYNKKVFVKDIEGQKLIIPEI